MAEERVSLITESQSFVDELVLPSENQNLNLPPVQQPLVKDDSGYSSDEEEGAEIVNNAEKEQESQKIETSPVV